MAKKILILEDEEELGKAIKTFLEMHHYQVSYRSDIAKVESIGIENPDLIITDLLMPRFHGFDICKQVKSDPHLQNIPLIVMTAVYKDSFHKLEVRRLGVEEFIEKPFRMNELLQRVQRLVGPGEPKEETPLRTQRTEEPIAPSPKTSPKEKSVTTAPPAVMPDVLPEEENLVRETPLAPDFHLPNAVIELEQIWENLQQQKISPPRWTAFRQKVHYLAGRDSAPGFMEISDYARKLEMLVDMIMAEGENTLALRKGEIGELLDKMRHHPLVSTELEIMRQMGEI